MAFIKAITPRQMHEMFGLYHGKWNKEMDRAWIDPERGYQVHSRMIFTKQYGNVEHVTISKTHKEGEPILATGGMRPIGWSEKMMIKNELFGEDRAAIEVYPKQKNLVDSADVYHLWVFDKKFEMPFGIHPSEYKKAINRGILKLNPEELTLLAKVLNGCELSNKDSQKILGLMENYKEG
ncbi:hypothetical protein [Pseudobutyrivibrio sp.]|uniref:DUF7694 domain-containing protein n=1 Tax=Pseudobutyrivibrio sp. TaxID=2014367 RepID=UPI00386E8471